MKILVAIPCLTGAAHVKEAIDSVIGKENVDVLIFDNGAEADVKAVIASYEDRPGILTGGCGENIYVNPAWNKFLDFFIRHTNYSHLIIMNSDLIMQKDWDIVLKKRWEINPNEILVPVITQDKGLMSADISTDPGKFQTVTEGTPGVFITIPRHLAARCYPIPDSILVWFGDLFIYSIFRTLGYPTIIPENLVSYHYWSQTVQRVTGISEIIEKDKLAWENSAKFEINNRIINLYV